MLETDVIGNKEWARGFLADADIRFLENIDCEIRIVICSKIRGTTRPEPTIS